MGLIRVIIGLIPRSHGAQTEFLAQLRLTRIIRVIRIIRVVRVFRVSRS